MHLLLSPVIIIALFLIIDFYLLRSVIIPRRDRRLTVVFCFIEAIPPIAMAIIGCRAASSGSPSQLYFLSVLMTLVALIAAPTFIYALAHVISLLPRLFHRRPLRGVRITGAIIAAIVMLLCLCGIFNRKRLTVSQSDIRFSSLPQQFDNYRIVHISDMHLGSFGSDTLFIGSLVDRINGLNPDLILFTGDIVSRHPDEMLPFISTLNRLNSADGIFAVLGNHDYCDYVDYDSEEDRLADRAQLRLRYAESPFVLLNDSTAVVTRGNDSIFISGTENIGQPPFQSYGSIERASAGVAKGGFSILLTHDPAAWTPDRYDYDLTLSGHTHSMQFNLLGISPAGLHHKRWEGLYRDGDHILNINRGIGTVGPLMRIGATPQISLILLHSMPITPTEQPPLQL